MKKFSILKKVVFTSLFAVLGICIASGLTGCTKGPKKEEKWAGTTIAFGSDIHIGASEKSSEKLRSAMDTFYKMDPALDAVVFAGDLVNNGFDEEYKEYTTIMSETKKEWTKLVGIMGNHEWYREGWGLDVLANGFTKLYQGYFTEGTGHPIESDTVVNGIHVIAVSPENETDAYRERERFIKDAVKKAAKEDPNKPIFVVAHKAPAHTVVSTWDDATGSTDELAPRWSRGFLEFLAEYPQIIYVAGHTHDSLKTPLSIYQKDYTVVNDGSIGSGQGLFVHISKENVVTIHRMNTRDGSEVAEPWVIDIPKVVESKDNFTYDQKRYDASATLTFADPTFVLEAQGAENVTITLPEATGEDTVHCGYPQYYVARIFDKKADKYISTSETEATKYYFYVEDGKIDLKKEFTELTPGTEYRLELYAINPLFKPSETITFDFATKV